VIELWELKGANDACYSLFSWRTRMALAHKGLAFEAHPVLMSDKAAIAFSGGKTVPVIRDGDTVVRDSWKIAEHLEAAYPQAPALFGGDIGLGMTHTFNIWADRVLVPAMLPVIVADIHDLAVDPADRGYVRGMFEKILGRPLEEVRAARAEAQKRLDRTLEPLQATLKRQAFVCGAAPAYADYIAFSVFQWARIASPAETLAADSPLHAWRERLLDLHGGHARAVTPAAATR
jgi:glutathione S-transferase